MWFTLVLGCEGQPITPSDGGQGVADYQILQGIGVGSLLFLRERVVFEEVVDVNEALWVASYQVLGLEGGFFDISR